MWTCRGCGTENKGVFCKKCGTKRDSRPRACFAAVSRIVVRIKEFVRGHREMCVFFAGYALAFFVLNSLNELGWWIASNNHARDLTLEGFIHQWMREYLFLYIAIPLPVEWVLFRRDPVKLDFLRNLGLRLSALMAGLALFYLVYGCLILRILDRHNFLRYNDTNSENMLVLTGFLVIAQPLSVFFCFCLKTLLVKTQRGHAFRG